MRGSPAEHMYSSSSLAEPMLQLQGLRRRNQHVCQAKEQSIDFIESDRGTETAAQCQMLSTKVIQFAADNDHEVLLRHILARDEFRNTPACLGRTEIPEQLSKQWWETPSARIFRRIARTLFEENKRNLLEILLKTPKLQILQNELFIPIVITGAVELLILNLAQGGSWNFDIPRNWPKEYGLDLLRRVCMDSYKSGILFHWTPLILAVELGQTDLVEYMLSHSPDSASSGEELVDRDLNPHFVLAVMRNHKDTPTAVESSGP